MQISKGIICNNPQFSQDMAKGKKKKPQLLNGHEPCGSRLIA